MSRLRWPDSTNSVSEKPGTIHVDSGRLQPSDAWIVLRSFLVAAAQTHAAVCILLAENRPKPLMLQAGVLNRSLFEVFAAVLALDLAP